ncbi:hypothetical protein [Levilactobacillus tujiorum]|uniref:hypothetical protein n=1 Tax=Levilactobacillus tujiorum TaxID=2912243 RepID=UPI00145794EB|nr:hypothetical protein [Levilactobacillus tujiorum]NLR32795.1 hypothetical protein [Levilactobacillus tujiorum]
MKLEELQQRLKSNQIVVTKKMKVKRAVKGNEALRLINESGGISKVGLTYLMGSPAVRQLRTLEESGNIKTSMVRGLVNNVKVKMFSDGQYDINRIIKNEYLAKAVYAIRELNVQMGQVRFMPNGDLIAMWPIGNTGKYLNLQFHFIDSSNLTSIDLLPNSVGVYVYKSDLERLLFIEKMAGKLPNRQQGLIFLTFSNIDKYQVIERHWLANDVKGMLDMKPLGSLEDMKYTVAPNYSIDETGLQIEEINREYAKAQAMKERFVGYSGVQRSINHGAKQPKQSKVTVAKKVSRVNKQEEAKPSHRIR